MYTPLIVDHFTNPRNVGEILDPNDEITIGNPVCGDTVCFHVKWDQDHRIVDAKYKAYGCATSIATASIFSEYIIGKTIHEIATTPPEVRNTLLGELEPPQRHCLDILHDLFAHFDWLATMRKEERDGRDVL